MKLPLEIIPDKMIQKYIIQDLAHKGFFYMEIPKGMCGLPQGEKIVNDKLKLHLENFGYDPELIIPGLWQHQTHPLQFSLVVYDFGIKYELQADITHILGALKTIYKISEEWDVNI